MGEVAISREELEVRTESETEKKNKNGNEDEEKKEEVEEETNNNNDNKKKKVEKDGERIVVSWEKFLARVALRVLLVEADDSTRQIIAALLRKCSYKVMAVSDGLKAWEMLKRRPCDIDLILTEVDLPAISGYALLTLIMEQEICKNVPVIMMSSQDSVSTVYKCMLRGAVDYLVKPIRRNELRNLWQHVWRRQSSLAGGNAQEESVGQDKVEATSENNAASNHSRGDATSTNGDDNKDFEKGSDAQSSCAKPDMEVEGTPTENMQTWGKLLLNEKNWQKHESGMDCGQKPPMHENEAGAMATCKDSNQIIEVDNVDPDSRSTNAKVAHEACDNNHLSTSSSREAIDFMGASASHKSSLNNIKSKFDFIPDLRLTRCHPSGFEIQFAEDRHTLRHSNASAFTQYNSRPSQLTQENISNQKELRAYSERKFSSNVRYNSDAPGPPPSTERTIISLASDQIKESEVETYNPQHRVFSIQIPVNGVGFNNLCTSYASMFPPTICKQSGASPIPSPSSGSQPELNCKLNPFQLSNFRSNSENFYDQLVRTNDTTNQSLPNLDMKLDSREDRGLVSPTTDQSVTSSFCNGAASHLNIGFASTSGSNGNVDPVANIRVAAERKNDENLIHLATSHQSIQREAALTKFRLKRKDRCYEKKVRYESRKKLAEQRPRVKGQFVRHANPPPVETEQ